MSNNNLEMTYVAAIFGVRPPPLTRNNGYVPLPYFRTCNVFRECNNPNGCGVTTCPNDPNGSRKRKSPG